MTFFLALFLFAAGDFAGVWNLESQDDSGNTIKTQLTLKEDAGVLKGELRAGSRTLAIEKITVSGETVTFPLQWGDQPITITLTMKDGALSGSWKTPEGDTGKVSGKKAEAAAAVAGAHPMAGAWKMTAVTPNGNELSAGFNLTQAAGEWKGELVMSNGGTMPVAEVKLSESTMTFKVQGQSAALVTLQFADGVWKGNFKTDAGDTGPVTLKR